MNYKLFTQIGLAACILCVPLCAQEKSPQGHVVIMGQLEIKAGREQDFLKLIKEMAGRTKREDHGNIRYEFFTAMPMRGQATAQSSWILIEEWKDQSSAAAHQKWAGPLVQTSWKEMTDSMKFMRLTRVAIE